ncbi:hypothetical protein WN944_011364 [Citrus x changshan-huyou]|uniref:Transmembrane 9 superfamily member n=1 Tax=Citrus x changshan-huyou TaxID=2935761 RepID=A0AAP0MT95_9ROSI
MQRPLISSDSVIKEKKEALGKVLNEDRLVSAPYKLNFRDDKESVVVCRKKLSKEEVVQSRNAVEKDYYFQMYYDDLLIWGFIGKVDKEWKTHPTEDHEWWWRYISSLDLPPSLVNDQNMKF